MRGKGTCGLFLAALAAIASVVWFGYGILTMCPVQENSTGQDGIRMMDKFDSVVTNLKSEALDGILDIKQVYWLNDRILSAPKPRPSNYGKATAPQQMQDVLGAAESLLDGQSLYFGEEVSLLKDSEIRYYLDESILAISWKEVHDDCVYTFAEVKIGHPSQFRRFLSGGEFGSEKQCTTTEMSADVNAVVASSGDFYKFRNFGAVVYEGVPQRLVSRRSETCFVNQQGDLIFSHAGELNTMEELKAFVDKNQIRFSLAFGPILVEDGVLCAPSYYEIGEIQDRYARAALCQMDRLHYLLVAANAEGEFSHHVTIQTFAEQLAKTGCKMAYTLDGGQTATIAMEHQVINHVSYGTQRKISDIIYFATAVPDGG